MRDGVGRDTRKRLRRVGCGVNKEPRAQCRSGGVGRRAPESAAGSPTTCSDSMPGRPSRGRGRECLDTARHHELVEWPAERLRPNALRRRQERRGDGIGQRGPQATYRGPWAFPSTRPRMEGDADSTLGSFFGSGLGVSPPRAFPATAPPPRSPKGEWTLAPGQGGCYRSPALGGVRPPPGTNPANRPHAGPRGRGRACRRGRRVRRGTA